MLSLIYQNLNRLRYMTLNTLFVFGRGEGNRSCVR